LLESERAFARTSVEKGIRHAFLEFLAEDAVLFRPGPVPGVQWLNQNPSDPGRLSWEPSYAEVSQAGDLGFTTGPYEYRGVGEKPRVGYGHFVSVWKKQADGTWRVAIDFGSPHPKPEQPEVLALRPGNGATSGKTGANRIEERAKLLAADQAFAAAAESGPPVAYAALADHDILFLRFRQPLVTGREAALGALKASPGRLSWKAEAGDVSSSSDLGYTYGSAQFQPGEAGAPAHAGYYLRVWRREPGGAWRVALDLMVVTPPQPR
ncbi:MAG: YybH family protein, partial [Terriglobales bacterium]